ncbi:MAG: hypothetical protein JHC98_05540 [Thermoleophilaceae bacterium]|nr:hypothetical protein [Thermoleophilaceae bacterium]
MLGKKTYDQEYIDASKKAFDAELAAYRKLAASGDPVAVKKFEPTYCAHQVLALEAYFVHRLRGVEGKDGNPCNEVRVIANSWMENAGVMAADSQIRLDPEKSITGLAVGDRIVIDEKTLTKLAKAYFAEIEARFT